ncbi:MAG: vanadium-dependent haloperoxidase [Gemmatimonadales bacterium]
MLPQFRSVSFTALVTLGLTAGCAKTIPPVEPRFVAELMQNQYGLIRSERISPPVASRITAYASVALFEGVAAGSATLRSLAGQLAGFDSLPTPETIARHDPQLVGLAAQRTVLDSLYREGLPQTKAAIASLFDSLWTNRAGQGIDAATAERSRAYGLRIGLAVVAWAGTDGFDTTRTKPWTPPVGPQYWVNSSGADEFVSQNQSAARDFVALDNPSASLRPGQASERSLLVTRPKPASTTTVRGINPVGATEPWWGSLRTFGLTRGDECPIEAPAPYSVERNSAFYREAMATYDAGKNLDDEKHQIVLYWADNPGQSGTPTGHWLSIGSQMVSQLGLDADRAAELFVLASLAQADAFIAAWRVKYETMVVRPNTYINRLIDPKWETDIITPPFPEYPSGHSVQSGAASAVMTKLLGDKVAFDDSTNLAIGHPVRRFDSFFDAADEAAMSRLYGGIHYPMAITHGNAMGRCIGERVVTRLQTRRGS